MNTSRRILLAGLVLFATAGALSAQTVAYWRFEDSSNIGTDSSANNHTLTLAGSGGGYAANDGFFNPVPKTGAANTGMFNKTSGNALTAAFDTDFQVNSFTLEASLNVTSTPGALAFVAGQFLSSGVNHRSYAMVLSSSREFGVVLSANGTAATQYYSGFTLDLNSNYYLGVAVNTAAAEVDRNITFYIKNLTADTALQTFSISGASIVEASLFDSPTAFSIGSQGNGTTGRGNLIGSLDEVRLSAGVLSQNDLLIASIPEPSTFALLSGVIAVGCAGLRRRRR